MDEMLSAIADYYSGSNNTIWQKIQLGTASAQEISYAFSQIPQKQLIIDTALDGSTLGYSYADPVYMQTLNNDVQQILDGVNSNLTPGQYADGNSFTGHFPGTFSGGGGSDYTVNTGSIEGASGVGNTVMTIADRLSLAVTGVNVGAKLGKVIDETLYNANPEWWDENFPTINPDTWTSIAGKNELGESFIRVLFGIKDGNMTTYVPEDVLVQVYQLLRDLGYMDTTPTIDPSVIVIGNIAPAYIRGPVSSLCQEVFGLPLAPNVAPDNTDALLIKWHDIPYIIINMGNNPFDLPETITVTLKKGDSDNTWYIDGHIDVGYTYGLRPNSTNTEVVIASSSTVQITSISNTISPDNSPDGYVLIDGTLEIKEIKTNPNSNQYPPDAITGTTFNDVKQQLKNTYPDLFANPIHEDVLQPDGTIKTITYIPVPWGTEKATPESYTDPDVEIQQQTQTMPKTNPEVTNKTETDYYVDPEICTDILGEPTISPPSDTTPDVPVTGTGESPEIVPVTGSASSLWAIYNPSQSEVNAFGAWLWNSDFVEQLKKLFNDPMQAIIGIHKVFVTPDTGNSEYIKCGYLTSTVSAKTVTSQYKSIDCGTVSLNEYFGNVFDYDPYTIVKCFLPFIGIVTLNVADIMRSRINIKYTVDVITGACIAEIKISRDGNSSILYTYSGSAIVSYPLSSGSYAGVVAGVLSITAGLIGTAMSGGAMLPAMLGAGAALPNAKTHTSINGQFTGCAGAMGGKIPYLIITRPITRVAAKANQYTGFPSNYNVKIGSVTGFFKCVDVHLCISKAYKNEIDEIMTLLKTGVLTDGVRNDNQAVVIREIEPLKVTVNGKYIASGNLRGYSPVTVDVPNPPLYDITIDTNGSYNPSDYNYYGFGTLTVNVSSGGIPLININTWNTYTAEQKRSYGLVALEYTQTGYDRGELINGADYYGTLIQTGTGSNNVTFASNVSGNYKLLVLALNSEASTHNLDITVTQNGNTITGNTITYNAYYGSGVNRRNYRFNLYEITLEANDTINITVTNASTFTSLVYAVTDIPVITNMLQEYSTADSVCSGSYNNNCHLIMGTFNANNGGTIELQEYTANTQVQTANPGYSYKSAYIFWF